MSVNDNPESLLVLPLIREDMADKIMLFKIEHQEMPLLTRTGQERVVFWNQLMAGFPSWLHYLQGWECRLVSPKTAFREKHLDGVFQSPGLESEVQYRVATTNGSA